MSALLLRRLNGLSLSHLLRLITCTGTTLGATAAVTSIHVNHYRCQFTDQP
ncbi:hypothetical protein [Sansalvadorimonas verongulae]|uniref:hypothetical protein n=1 Tax=Sansalvadorimonas verongulae TaxID=2172824 RepID=UPI0012BC9888|nr:hypothetical protein [Sansalvadorimonas verongulae]